jgi:hypothetical protein
MSHSLPHRHRLVKPAVCESVVLRHPCAPCELLPAGQAGVLEINGTHYAIEILGYLPEVGEPVVDGYRLTKPNGEAHDLCIVAGRMECTCGDWLFRRSCQTDASVADCKHVLACKHHFAEPVDQRSYAVDAIDAEALLDGECRMLAGPEITFDDP